MEQTLYQTSRRAKKIHTVEMALIKVNELIQVNYLLSINHPLEAAKIL